MARRFVWVVFDQSTNSIYGQFGTLTEAAAMQAVADAGMSLHVHFTGMSGEYWVSSKGFYQADLYGPLIPNYAYNNAYPIYRTIYQRGLNSRPFINNWINSDWLEDDKNGRLAYIIEYSSEKEYLLSPDTINDDTPQYMRIREGWLDFIGGSNAGVIDLAEFKIWAVSPAGIDWQIEWPRGSGLYGKRPSVQFTGSGGTLIYQKYALVPTEEIAVQQGWNGELVLGEAADGLDLDDYRRGFGFNGRSWIPSDVSADSAKPPLFWEIVSGVSEPSIPAVALLPCESNKGPEFTSCIVVAILSDDDIPNISEFMRSPNWEAARDPDNYNERRIVVVDIFNIAGCYSRVFNKPDYESPVFRLSSDGLGLYNYVNLVKNTLVEIPLAALASSGLDVANTRPLVIAENIRHLGSEDFYMNGFSGDKQGVFLSPGGGASAFWKSLIKMTERL